MPPPNDDTKTVEHRGTVEHRATSSHKGSRGITNNGVPRKRSVVGGGQDVTVRNVIHAR